MGEGRQGCRGEGGLAGRGGASALQAEYTVKFCKIAIEGAERQMTGFAGNFQHETIGETQ